MDVPSSVSEKPIAFGEDKIIDPLKKLYYGIPYFGIQNGPSQDNKSLARMSRQHYGEMTEMPLLKLDCCCAGDWRKR